MRQPPAEFVSATSEPCPTRLGRITPRSLCFAVLSRDEPASTSSESTLETPALVGEARRSPRKAHGLRARSRRALCAAFLLACGMAGAVRAEPLVAVALIVSVDVSQSVDAARFGLQMEGIAEALEDPGVVAAMTARPGGTLFALVTWADRASLAVGWRRIASRADAVAAAAQVRATPRQTGEFTCLARMFRTIAGSVIPAMPVSAERIVVDVSGDGIDNCTDPDDLATEQAAILATGATINGLPILVPGENDVVGAGAYRSPGYGLRATPLPQERIGLEQWFQAHVVAGPNAFMLAAKGYSDFSRAIRRKFITEISLYR